MGEKHIAKAGKSDVAGQTKPSGEKRNVKGGS